LNPISVTETEIEIVTPPKEDSKVVPVTVFYKNFEIVDCQGSCEYTYSDSLTPKIDSAVFTGYDLVFTGTGFTSSSCSLIIDGLEQKSCTVDSDTSISSTVDDLKFLVGIFKIKL